MHVDALLRKPEVVRDLTSSVSDSNG
jgi:hypothetical protein